MNNLDDLLILAKAVAVEVGVGIYCDNKTHKENYFFSDQIPGEIKSKFDFEIEKKIIESLKPSGLSILSEESGFIQGEVSDSSYLFVIDPLDGTYNFVKDLGPSAISIALWDGNTPVFGVIYLISSGCLAWGGPNYGAFLSDQSILVSNISELNRACICTGFPVRFDYSGENAMQKFWGLISNFSKVRMIGSAAVSLCHVARGSADVYIENNIMFWDVAAGIALVIGAGGSAIWEENAVQYSVNVFASNGHLRIEPV